MEIDRTTIKALSADTRLLLLKKLTSRRKMPSELSRETGLAPSTVVEHLKVLEQAQLVEKQAAGKKWVYYSVTEKGMGLIAPRTPIRLVLTAMGGLVLTAFGVMRMAPQAAVEKAASIAQGEAAVAQEQALQAAAQGPDILAMAALLAGIIAIAASLALLSRWQSRLPAKAGQY